MSRKKKNTAADIKRRLIDDDRDVSPFASIKLVEKKEEPRKAKPIVKSERKKPSEIVQGYDPSSSFADILYSFEHTGNPYSMPRPTKGSVPKDRTDFGAILDRWEGKTPKTEKRQAGTQIKSTYTPTRSFADILDTFEGRKPAKAEPDPASPSDVDAKKAEKMEEPQKPLSENLFRKADEGESIASSASWTIFGGRNESFVRPEKPQIVKEETKERKEDRKAEYHPTKSFGDILSSYEGKAKPRQKAESKETKARNEQPEVLSDNLYRKREEDEISSSVSWSVFGGRNDNFVRPAKEDGDAEPKIEGKMDSYTAHSSFGDILQRYSKEKEDVKTFEEYMKEKGDDEKRKETLTLSRLRTMPPQSTLDLHGYTVKEAESAVKAFLDECHANGLRKISIITGKGLHSEDGIGVLKATVQTILDESGLVSEKASAPLSAGGSGALWIILKA